MPRLVLSFFGPFRATLDGQPFQTLRSARIQSLLVYLALEPGRQHRREVLAAHFWPDESAEAAKQNLRQALYQLRQRLGDDQSETPFLLLTREHVEFNRASSVQLDVALFQGHLQQQRLAEAVALYTGELLEDLRSDSDRVEEWLIVQREHFHLLALDALQKLAEQELADKNYPQAQQYARRQLALEPWREIAHRQLMLALAATGDRTGALAHYESCRQLLLRELGVEPDGETRALVARIRDGALGGWGDGEKGRKGERKDDSTFHIPHSPFQKQIDWGDMPEVAALHGREVEMAELERWLLAERCRLVTIVGMGGMGKTTLAAKATRQIAEHFEVVIWRSLLNAPPLSEIVRSWLGVFNTLTTPFQATSFQATPSQNENPDANLAQLFTLLRQHRCLLVLDNVESILQGDERAGHYRSGYEAYGQFFRRMGETNHLSALLLTSRETPQEAARLERESPAVRIQPLSGLSQQAGLSILRRQGIRWTSDRQSALVERYSGNPLALMLVAETIHEIFDGDVDSFLNQDATIFDDIRDVLDQQFARLTVLERDILLWLAIEREPVGLSQLSANLQPSIPARALIEALNSLRRRSLIEKSVDEQSGFLLQNVVTEYLTDTLIERVCGEIQSGTPQIFKSHALLKAQAKEYVRQSQQRLIVQPLAERLRATLGVSRLQATLQNFLTQIRKEEAHNVCYAGGNLFNLLIQLGIAPALFDFSQLEIWQAYLAGIAVMDVNFSGCNFKDCVFSDPFGAMIAITFQPNGETIAAGSSVGNIRFWQAKDGQSLRLWHAHDNFIFSLFFSPDGSKLYSCSDDRRIRVWEMSNSATSDEESPPLLATLEGHSRGVWRLALSADGSLLASAGGDGSVVLWDAQTYQQLATHAIHTRGVRAVAIDPAGEWIVSGDEAGAIVLWQWGTLRTISLLREQNSGILTLAFSHNGKLFASGSYDGTIRLWDLSSIAANREIGSSRLLTAHTSRVCGVNFSPDDRFLVSCSDDQTVRLWEVANGQLRQTLQGHSDMVNSVLFNPAGTMLASSSNDRSVRLWDVVSGQTLRSIHGHAQGVMGIALSPNGTLLASAHQDHKVWIWQLPEGIVSSTFHNHQKEVATVAFHPNGNILASGSGDATIQLWDLRTNHILRTLRGHKGLVRMLCFSRDGQALLSCSNDYSVCLWDVQNGGLLRRQQIPFSIWSAAQSVDGKTWALGGTTGIIQLWDLARGALLLTLHGHNNWVTSLAYSPDGKYLASGGGDQLVLLWDAQSGEQLQTLNGHNSWVYAVAFSADGETLASASADKTITLWDMTSKRLVRRLVGHTNEVRSLAFNAKGIILYSGSMDETVCCWDTVNGECLSILRAPRPYEGMRLHGAMGITPSQRRSMLSLGAVDNA